MSQISGTATVKDDLEKKNHPIDKSKTFQQCYAITNIWPINI